VGLWACSRSEVSYELTVTEKGKGAVEEAARTRLGIPLAEVARECAEIGGAACQTLVARRAEVEAGGEVSKQAWIEALAKGCVVGRTQEACDAALNVLAPHKAEGVDASAVVASLREGCGRDLPMACVMAANALVIRGADLEVRVEDAADLFARACSLGERPACVVGADLYVEMVSDSPHGEKVLEFGRGLVRGPCEAGDQKACLVLAGSMVSQDIPESWREFARGRELAKGACDAKLSAGCNMYAEILILGLGGDRDVEGGRKLFDEVCAREVVDDATEAACRSLAYLHAGHLEVLPAEPEKARGYAKRACEVLGKLRPEADCFVAREIEDLLK